ncbi:MAG TPA: type II secretion system F family protein [Acidimicrobiales bacterium]
MAKYRYTAIALDGATVTGVEEADTVGQLRAILRNRDLEPVEAREKRNILRFELTRKKVPRKEVMHFSRQLAVFVRAGIPIIDGLEVIAEDSPNKLFRKVLVQMAESLRAGSTFADAAEAHPYAFPAFYRGILRSAELTGNLDVVLEQLSDYIERDITARQKITSALVYPAVITAVSLFAVAVLLVYVLPKFKTFFNGVGAKLPLPTRIMISAGSLFANWWWVLALGIAVVVIGSSLLNRTEFGKDWRDRILLQLPLIGDLTRHAVLERFCRILSSMVSAGVPLPDALVVTGEATNNRVFRRGVAASREAMMRGEGLAEPLAATGLFPASARQMFRVGEDTGTLDSQMATAADYFERELDYKLKRFTNLFEPAVIIVAGGIVAFIAIALVSAMYGIFRQVKL